MKIVKYIKTGTNKYKIILENGESIVLYEDVILKFDLLLKKEIEDLNTILEYNQRYALYDKVLGYLNKRLRSEKEIRVYLSKYTSKKEDIENIISQLKENHLLNNELYIKSYMNDKIHLGNDGPLKIKRDLLNLGFNELEIDTELSIFNKEIIHEKITKYLSKQLKSNQKSLYVFKNKMLFNLMNLGYEREDIVKVLDTVTISEDNLKEKEYLKLKKKLEKKYSGSILEQMIKRKLYEKGYRD